MKDQCKNIKNFYKNISSIRVKNRYVAYMTKDDTNFKIYDALEQKIIVDFEQRFLP